MNAAISSETRPRAPVSPDDARPMRFALLCHQRSGSNALSAMLLKNDRVRLYGQLFNPFLEYGLRNLRHGFGRYRPHPEPLRHFGKEDLLRPSVERKLVSCLPCNHDLEAFVDNFFHTYSEPTLQAVGFKLHDYQLTDADLRRVANECVDGTVMLWRRNRLKAAVSWAYAVRTDVWSRRTGQRHKLPALSLSIEELEWFIRKTRSEVDRWRLLLNSSGANWIEMTYEDHVKPRALSGLYEFLGLRYEGPPDFATKKLASARYEHITNAERIEAALGSPENGFLFA